MADLFNENGDKVEGALDPESAKSLQEKAASADTAAAKVVEVEAALKEKEAELNKMSKKDYDYKRLREKTEEEIEEMKSKMNEKEKMLLTEVVELTKERQAEKERSFKEAKSEILSSLCKGDKEFEKKVEENEKLLAGEAVTAGELEDRFRKAYILAKGELPRANPIFSGYSPSYSDPNTTQKKFTDTEQGKESVKKWFPEAADKIYKEKK